MAESEVVVIFALKVTQSAACRNPAWAAEEVACVKVMVDPEPLMVFPVVPDVAKVYAVCERVVPPMVRVVVVNPPLAAESTPAHPGVKVMVSPEAVITSWTLVPSFWWEFTIGRRYIINDAECCFVNCYLTPDIFRVKCCL